MKLNFSTYALLLVSINIPLSTRSQSDVKSFGKLSGPEKAWVIGHPFKAAKAWDVTREARAATFNLRANNFADTSLHGGALDAFRHAYWMARMTQEIGSRAARKLGRAHEKGNYKNWQKGRTEEGRLPDSLAGVMDLWNNNKGIETAMLYPTLEAPQLADTLLAAIGAGHMRMLKKNQNGHLCDCDGRIIDLNHGNNDWFRPYCLIPTEY